MKILIVNRNYFITGGPENYMFSLMENMPQHHFIPFCVDFEQNRPSPYSKYFVRSPSAVGKIYFHEFKMSIWQKVTYGLNSIYHREARRKMEALIQAERPDTALFLNSVYFSDSIIDACRKYNVPIIWRMSDFHKMCASYLLYRDGHVCEDCLEYGLTMAIRNRCGGYQRSTGAALIKVAGMWLSRLRHVYDYVDYFIAPSVFTRQKLIQGGFAPEKIIHLPTWVSVSEGMSEALPAVPEILYVGRLSYEKGVETLLEAFGLLMHSHARLIIVGDDTGSYADQLKQSIPAELKQRIQFTGFQNRAQIETLYKRATCIVVPSVCYDNQPNVVLEGMGQACPAVVSDHGSLRELVVDDETGFRFIPGNAKDLADKLAKMLDDPERSRVMGVAARRYVEHNHSMATHLTSLETLFNTCARAAC